MTSLSSMTSLGSKSSIRSVYQNRKTFLQKHKRTCAASITFIIATMVVIIVLTVVVLPKDNSKLEVHQVIKDGLILKPNLSNQPKGLGSFNNDAKPNHQTPAIKDNFPYSEMKIRGVNLGGWLVPEPFIVPSLYEPYIDSHGVVDEWTLCEAVGKIKCTEVLKHHYDTFVTEDEIKRIANSGLNHVRIPLGLWSIDNNETEPLVYGAWEYLLRGIQWCRKYGLRVLIDFQAAPGSPNNENQFGQVPQSDSGSNSSNPNSKDDSVRFTQIIVKVSEFFSQPEWRKVVTQIGVLNEPATMNLKSQVEINQFYQDSYELIKNKTKSSDPILVYSDGYLNPKVWKKAMSDDKFNRVALDIHNYVAFDKDLITKPLDELNDLPCQSWSKQLSQSTSDFGWSITGGFSAASHDCGPWLNGINLGSRYDGTYLTTRPICPECTCHQKSDPSHFTTSYRQFLTTFVQRQMSAYEDNGLGWYFMNFKTEDHINPLWDYFKGQDEGWIPKDASQRTHSCQKS